MSTIKIHAKCFPELTYRKSGTGDVIVLLHGFPESHKLWDEVIGTLSKQYMIIAPDLPGSGESAIEGNDLSMEQLAESVNAILEHEGIAEVVIAGHSMGGYAALAFADLHQHKIKGLALVHSAANADDEEKKDQRRKAISLIGKGGKEAFIKQMIPNMFSPAYKSAHPEVLENHTSEGLKLSAESLIAFYNAMINRPDRLRILEEADFPVQWMLGKDDAILNLDKALQQSKLASVNFVYLYDNVGHMSMLEAPDQFCRDLIKFTEYCYIR